MRKLLAVAAVAVITVLALAPRSSAQGQVVSCFTYSCSGLTCTFDPRCSQGGQGSYGWGFGDGTTGSSGFALKTHTYAAAGTYNVSLKVGIVPNFDVSFQSVTVP